MAIDTSMYGNIQQPTLASMLQPVQAVLGIQQSQQGLQNSQLQNQINQQVLQQQTAQAANATQTRNEQVALSQAYRDGTILGPDGRVDMDKYQKWAPANIPMTYASKGDEIARSLNSVTDLKDNVRKVGQETMGDVGGIIQSAIGPDGKMVKPIPQLIQDLQAYEQRNPGLPGLDGTMKHVYSGLAQIAAGADPQQMVRGLAAITKEAVPASTQRAEAQQTIGNMPDVDAQGRSSMTPVITAPTQGVAPNTPIGAPVPQVIAPGSQQSLGTDALNNGVVINRDPYGRIQTPTPVPGAGGAVPPTFSFPSGESSQTRQQLAEFRTKANQAAANVPTVADTANQIDRAADEIKVQGQAGQAVANLSSRLGFSFGKDSATALQQLGHATTLQGITLANQMGLNSVAGLQSAEQAASRPDWTPEAIKSANQTVRALNTGVGLFNKGMESTLKNNPGQDVFPVREFQNAWAQNFSVDAMRLRNAIEADGNKAGPNYAQVKASMSPAQFSAAQSKARTLINLSNGILP